MSARLVVTSVIALALGVLTGCGNEEGVMLSARMEAPAVTVTASALVTEVTGGFDLELSLGDRASDPTTVELEAFSLQRDGTVLLSPLVLDANPGFPLSVGVGQSKHVDLTFANEDGAPELGAELCASELQIVGAVSDSLGDGRPLTVTSERFAPDCP